MSTPQAVLDALQKLDPADQETIQSYINKLQTELQSLRGENESSKDMETEPTDAAADDTNGEPPFPPVYESGEDFEKAGDLKQEAADFVSNGNYEAALEKYTSAVLVAPPSALLYANRAIALLKLGRPNAAERDCDLALKENPDSAKALRVRGKARKELGKWEEALRDLSAAQAIDFDEGSVEDLKFLTEKHVEAELAEASERNAEKEKLRKRAEEIKKANEEAKKHKDKDVDDVPDMGGSSGGMPGMPPGMEGMMAGLMSDPELLAAMQNPKVQKAFQELMSGPGGPMGLLTNPAKMQSMMADPEVGPVLQKLMAKMGGMGGMPGASADTGSGAGADDDIPNLDDLDGDIDIDKLS